MKMIATNIASMIFGFILAGAVGVLVEDAQVDNCENDWGQDCMKAILPAYVVDGFHTQYEIEKAKAQKQ